MGVPVPVCGPCLIPSGSTARPAQCTSICNDGCQPSERGNSGRRLWGQQLAIFGPSASMVTDARRPAVVLVFSRGDCLTPVQRSLGDNVQRAVRQGAGVGGRATLGTDCRLSDIVILHTGKPRDQKATSTEEETRIRIWSERCVEFCTSLVCVKRTEPRLMRKTSWPFSHE